MVTQEINKLETTDLNT